MNSIPNEILDNEIFPYFPLDEIIKLREVNKKFRDTIDKQMKFNEVSIFVGQYPFYETYYYTKECINLNLSLKCGSLDFLNNSYFKIKFKNIRKLALFLNPSLRLRIQIDESGLNYYQNLIYLEIRHVSHLEGCLKLPNLQILSIDSILKCNFEIRCPSLCALNLNGEANVESFENSNSLAHLESSTILNNFSQFQNLTTFICYKLSDIKLDWLAQLNNLEEIHIYSIKKKEYLLNLIEEKNRLNLVNLKIRFAGIDIADSILFENLCYIFEYLFSDSEIWSSNFLTSRLLKFYTRNCAQLDDHLQFIEYLEIDNFEISESILIKLNNLKTLYVFNQFIDDDKFNLLIRHCRKLKYIQFYSIKLDQSQFDLMPHFLNDLRHLEFKKCDLDNFYFVSSFKNLEFFACNQKLRINQLKKIILNCKLCKTIKAELKGNVFLISLIYTNVRYEGNTFQFDSFDHLIQHLDYCNSIKQFINKLFTNL